LNSVSLRYFNAAGSDPEGRIGERHEPETHIIPLVLLEALRVRAGGDPAASGLVVHGDDYDTPDGTCIRDYVHVDDLAAAHLRAAERMVEGSLAGAHAYNLGTARGFSVLEVIESGRRVTGVAIRHRAGPRRPGDPPRLVADASAATRELAWAPRYVALDAIVATAWAWFSSRRIPERNGAVHGD
jgi:UDP-glucose 4-epimerase